MKLYEFGCSCIGFDEQTIVRPCESNYDNREYFIRSDKESRILDRNKPGVELDAGRTAEILVDLNMLIIDGYRFREIRSLLVN